MSEVEEIKVEWSPSSIWGDFEPSTNYAQRESEYALALTAALRDEYPDAKIRIVRGINDRVQVNHMTDHDEVPWIEEIQGRVWRDWLDSVSCSFTD